MEPIHGTVDSDVSETRNLDRRLWISAALNLTITLVELAGGILAGSLALLADALHNFADAGALGVAIFARWLGRQAPTPRHTYGFKTGGNPCGPAQCCRL